MRDLFQKVASMESAAPTHYTVSPGHDGRPRAIMVQGPARRTLAKRLHGRFGHSIVVLDAESMETQQIDHASGLGAPLVGVYRAPVQGRNTSDSSSVLLEEIKRLGLDDEEPSLKDAVVFVNDAPSDDSEGPVGGFDSTVLTYASTEAFLKDFGKAAVFEVRVGNESFFEHEEQILARLTESSLESEDSLTPTIGVRGLTLEPCRHGHTDPDTDCPLCEMMSDANDAVRSPIMTAEGKILELPKSDVKVLPNKRPALALPEAAGDVRYEEHDQPNQTILVPEDVIIEDDLDDEVDHD